MNNSLLSSRHGRQCLSATVGSLMVAALITAPALAQQTPRTVYLFNASLGSAPIPAQAATAAPWGNGEAKPTRQRVDYEGATPLELTTRNLAEGARFDLKQPIDIEPYVERGFVRMRLRFADQAVAPNAPGIGFNPGMQEPNPGGPNGNEGNGGRRRRNQGGNQGGNPGWGNPGGNQAPQNWDATFQFREPGGALPPIGTAPFPGLEGGFPGGGLPVGPPPQTTPIKQLRVTFLREQGTMMGRIDLDLDKITADKGGWRLFTLPIKDMKSSPGASGPVKRVLITGDANDTFFVAQAALVIETGQVTVSIRRPSDPVGSTLGEIQVKPGRVSLIADVEAGAADPIVEWNFDADNVGFLPPPAINGNQAPMGAEGGFDPAMGAVAPNINGAGMVGPEGGAPPQFNGPRIDARGISASFRYPNEEQNYRVEVTVKDQTGKKQPVTSSILVKVRG